MTKIEDAASDGKIINISKRTDDQWDLILKQNEKLLGKVKRLEGFQENILEAVERSVSKLPGIPRPQIPKIQSRYKEEYALW